jgi:hypothetical protein
LLFYGFNKENLEETAKTLSYEFKWIFKEIEAA